MSDESTEKNNGADQERRPVFATLTIEVIDLVTGSLHITGKFPNLDYVLNMLAQATRELEAQWKLQRAAQYQEAQAAAAQTEAIRRDLQRSH